MFYIYYIYNVPINRKNCKPRGCARVWSAGTEWENQRISNLVVYENERRKTCVWAPAILFINLICNSISLKPLLLFAHAYNKEPNILSKSMQPLPGDKQTKSHPKPLKWRFWETQFFFKLYTIVPSSL